MPGRLNEEHFLHHCQELVRQDLGFVIGLFDKERFVGGLGAVCAREFATGDLAAIEQFWYVLPECRTGGLRLLRAFEEEARVRGCVRLHMVHLQNHCAEKLDCLYERLGYRLLEKSFTKDV